MLQELGEARDTPRDIIFDDLWSAAFADQPLGRSVLGDEDEHRRDRASTICTPGATDQYRAGGLILVAAGKVEHDALVELAEARFGDLPAGRDRARPSRRRFTGGDAGRPAARRPGPSRPRLCRRRPSSIRIIMPRGCSPTSSAAACRRACSRRCARSGASPIRSMSTLQPYRDAGLFYVYAATAPARVGRGRAADRARCSPRPPASVTPARARPGPGPGQGRPADVARKPLGPGRVMSPASSPCTAGWSSRPRWSRELEAVTLDQVRAAGREDARRAAGARHDRRAGACSAA